MGWAKIHDDDGIINLRQYYDEDHAIAYAHCVVFSPDDREATMYLGSNDGAKLWLNGEEVHKSNPHRRLKVDDDRIEVSLRRGWNTVLLKVAQSGGDWEFAFRVKDINDELYFGTHIPRTAGEKAPSMFGPLSGTLGERGWGLSKRCWAAACLAARDEEKGTKWQKMWNNENWRS